MKIKKWIRSQELPETETTEELIEEAGSALDAACPHDICGETIFVGEDGQVYVGTVEFNLNPIHPEPEKALPITRPLIGALNIGPHSNAQIPAPIHELP
jgi:hypothetical protein